MDAEDGTVPLDETYTETVSYHGRTFQQHALANKIYFAPIDEEEIAQLGEMHSMLRTVFDNRLIFPPVSRLKMILECGFGAGDWSVDVAEQYPDAETATLVAVRTSQGYVRPSGNGRQPHGVEDMLTGSGGPVADWMILRQTKKMYTGVIAMLMKLQVIGLDISPHMIPEELPDNLDLQIDDLNGE
ncbi:hypothetical protein ACHAPE_007454 [Trichoderma viride]